MDTLELALYLGELRKKASGCYFNIQMSNSDKDDINRSEAPER